MDLDTLPVGDLSDLCSYDGGLAMLSDFYQPARAQSGVILFRPGPVTDGIWDRWIASPSKHMRRYRGDGEFLHASTKPDRIQELYPGQVVSLKVHAHSGPPGGARLVCGHGHPRFSSTDAGWAHTEWARRVVG